MKVDPKRVTFPEFEQMPRLFAPIVKDGDLLYLAGSQLLRLQSLFAPKIQLPNRKSHG